MVLPVSSLVLFALLVLLFLTVGCILFLWQMHKRFTHLQQHHITWQHAQRESWDQYRIESLTQLQHSLQTGLSTMNQQLLQGLEHHKTLVDQQMGQVCNTITQQLNRISQQVDQRLETSFEKTHRTFQEVTQRLALIDQAQQRIQDLSSNVVSLQALLADKRARGALGEVQLTHLVKNVLPTAHFQLQHTLSNGKRVDCLLQLPPPPQDISLLMRSFL